MRTPSTHDRPREADLAPRQLLAFLLALGLMASAYTVVHYAAQVDADSGRLAGRVVQPP